MVVVLKIVYIAYYSIKFGADQNLSPHNQKKKKKKKAAVRKRSIKSALPGNPTMSIICTYLILSVDQTNIIRDVIHKAVRKK